MKNIIALLIFAGGFYGWYLHHQKTQAEESLQAARYQLAEVETSTAARRAEFQAAEKAMSIKTKVNDQKAELARLQTRLQALSTERSSVQAERQAALGAIRQKFIGRTFPLITTGGRDLGQVRIIKMDDSGLSVATTTGVAKVLPNELPQDLRSQFLYSF
ncbi:MAG: hypothetical protein CJBNEKGG_03970 [Prosthecobacter sp.]|nr:hypothetical protein [Prosthecobacter sp.]